MEELKERILKEGEVIGEDVLKVDSFLNHQVDPQFIMAVGREIASRFAGEEINKVLTIEASGIAVAMAVGYALGVRVVFAKKGRGRTQIEGTYTAPVYSFTRQEKTNIYVTSKFISPGDRVLIVDDFLAHGQSLSALNNIVKQAKATLVGAGIVIEKQFQGGGERLRAQGIRIESLAGIRAMRGGRIVFA